MTRMTLPRAWFRRRTKVVSKVVEMVDLSLRI